MKRSFLFAIVATISGCCHLPLVDCGPKIEKLNVSTEKVKLTSEKEIQINAFQYYSRTNDEPAILHLEIESLKTDSVFIEKASIYIAKTVQQGKIKAELFNQSTSENLGIQSFSFQFIKCCKNYPIEVKLDSIPVITNSDTIYASLNIKIRK